MVGIVVCTHQVTWRHHQPLVPGVTRTFSTRSQVKLIPPTPRGPGLPPPPQEEEVTLAAAAVEGEVVVEEEEEEEEVAATRVVIVSR